MIGPLLFTQVFAIAISPHVGVHVPGAPYYLAASLMLASACVACIVARPALLATTAQGAGGPLVSIAPVFLVQLLRTVKPGLQRSAAFMTKQHRQPISIACSSLVLDFRHA